MYVYCHFWCHDTLPFYLAFNTVLLAMVPSIRKLALELQVGMAANFWTVNLRANKIEVGGGPSEVRSTVRRPAEPRWHLARDHYLKIDPALASPAVWVSDIKDATLFRIELPLWYAVEWPPSPLRTGRETFASSGSSTKTYSILACRQLARRWRKPNRRV